MFHVHTCMQLSPNIIKWKTQHDLFAMDTILCRITCAIILLSFMNIHKSMDKISGFIQLHVDLQRKWKLHIGNQTLVTARSLEGTIINYIYSYSPWRGEVVPFLYTIVCVSYSTQSEIASCKNFQKLFTTPCQCFIFAIITNKIYMDLKAILYRIDWSLFQIHSPKHVQIIMFIMKFIIKPL